MTPPTGTGGGRGSPRQGGSVDGEPLVVAGSKGSVGILTLNRPHRHNSLVPDLLHDFRRGLRDLRRRAGFRALLLQARGPSFSTGGDVRAFYDRVDDGLGAYAHTVVGLLHEVILELLRLPVPVAAAVHGPVTGGSMGLVLASDIVLVAPEAGFTPYYAVVGFSPDGGWTTLLPEIVGRRRTAEVIATNRTITAQEAVDWGIATRVAPAGRVREEALAAAAQAADMVGGAVERTRRLLEGRINVVRGLERERQHFVRQITTPRARRGMEDFLDIEDGERGGGA